MKKALVTGATGYLGKNLVPKLESGFYTNLEKFQCDCINTLNCDLREWKDIFHFHLDHEYPKYDYIFHLAAETKAGDYCLTHQGDQWLNNQLINVNLLKYWKQFQFDAKMIAIGTSCMYDPKKIPTKKNILKGQPEKSLFTYAMAKRMLLVGLESFAEQFDMEYIMFVPSTIYGPGFEKNDDHFIFDLIRKIYNYKITNQKAILWGDGNQIRDVIYIDDLVEKILNNINFHFSTNDSPFVYNISSEKLPICEYVKIICNILNVDYDNAIVYDELKYIGAKEKFILSQDSDFSTSINIGLEKTINYYIEQYGAK